MLRFTGEVLGVEHRRVDLPDRPSFDVTTVHVLDGLDKFELRVSRDAEVFARSLTRGEIIDLPISASAYKSKAGEARVQLTLLAPEAVGARVES